MQSRKFLSQVAQLEWCVERARVNLKGQADFTVNLGFVELDQKKRNRIDSHDVMQYMRKFAMDCSSQEAQWVIGQYDCDDKGFLWYQEFARLVMPQGQTEAFGGQRKAGATTLYLLAVLLQQEINYHRGVSRAIDRGSKQWFKVISQGEDVISRHSLIQFLDYSLDAEVDGILRRIASQKGFISQRDWERFVDQYQQKHYRCQSVDFSNTHYEIAQETQRRPRNLRVGFSLNNSVDFSGQSELRQSIQNSNFTLRKSCLKESQLQKTNKILIRSQTKVESQFASFLYQIIKAFKTIEPYRNELSLQPDFSLNTAFKYFDKEGRGFLSSQDMYRGLIRLGVIVTKEQADDLIRLYSRFNQKTCRFSEFSKMISSKDNYYAQRVTNRSYGREKSQLGRVTREIMAQMFQQILLTEIKLKDILKNCKNCDLENWYGLLDKEGQGYFTYKGLYEFLLKQKIMVNKQDVEYLIDRFDRDSEGRINIDKFSVALSI